MSCGGGDGSGEKRYGAGASNVVWRGASAGTESGSHGVCSCACAGASNENDEKSYPHHQHQSHLHTRKKRLTNEGWVSASGVVG